MLQLAAWLGHDPLVLIGCDTRYVLPEGQSGLYLSAADGEDPNHFHPRYLAPGQSVHHPQVDKMLMYHAFARRALDAAGVRVINATVGGDLEVYERRPLKAFLD